MNSLPPESKSWKQIREELEILVNNAEKNLFLLNAQLEAARSYEDATNNEIE